MHKEKINLSTATRFERKYRCSYHQYYAIMNALYPFILKDAYTTLSPINKYLVRSLYFDTHNYQIFLEKIGGNASRIKFRIRTYSDTIHDEPDIRVEMKVRQANLTQKYGSFISFADCQYFQQFRHWRNQNDPILEEFERQVHMRDLHPKILVEYLREGYQTKFGEGIRLTFDHQIKSASSRTLFPSQIMWQNHYDPTIVLEIKHQDKLPDWLLKIIKQNGLRLVANSKFAFGIERSRRDLIFAGWSNG